MRAKTVKSAYAVAAVGAALLAGGVAVGVAPSAFATGGGTSPTSASPSMSTSTSPSPSTSTSPRPHHSHSPATTSTRTPKSSPCPPAPAGRKGQADRGFFTVGPVTGTSAGLPVVTQPLTVQLFCYDLGTQQATIHFTGLAPTGAGATVPILAGTATFSFTGHQRPDVVDATQTYRIDTSVLGTPAADGWHVQARIDITNDRSAFREVPFVIAVPKVRPTPSPTPTTPSPSVSPTVTPTVSPSVSPTVLPTKITQSPTPVPTQTVPVTPAPSVLPTRITQAPTLPFTGSAYAAPMAATGGGLVALGSLVILAGRRRRA